MRLRKQSCAILGVGGVGGRGADLWVRVWGELDSRGKQMSGKMAGGGGALRDWKLLSWPEGCCNPARGPCVPFTTTHPHPQADAWLWGHEANQPRVWGLGPPSPGLPGVTGGQRLPRRRAEALDSSPGGRM